MAVKIDAYHKISSELNVRNVTLVAVSKIRTIAEIKSMYDLGQRDFGENYVQELLEKHEALPKDIRWHFIGHLQTNKVKYIASFVSLIHGVDSEKLLSEINKQGKKINRVIPCLLQVYISKDETKFGFDEQELAALVSGIQQNKEVQFNYVSVKGLMGMATFTEDNDLIKAEFAKLKVIFDQYASNQIFQSEFTILSMGMSADYSFAVDAGSTMVRIGSLLFGFRNNKPG